MILSEVVFEVKKNFLVHPALAFGTAKGISFITFRHQAVSHHILRPEFNQPSMMVFTVPVV